MSKKVFVGLSGGVDSSVAALLLKKQGYDVTGVFIRTWHPDFIQCTEKEDRLDAMRVAVALEIPFLECDAVTAYKEAVAKYMIDEYAAGRTPNPDILCNKKIKFGVFWDFAQKHGATHIATGHYARIIDGELHGAVDTEKDQSYFLWQLTKEDLSHTLFPLGDMQKQEVRTIAKKHGLHTATKKDSQGVCMLGDLDIKEFLGEYLEKKKGEALSEEGEVIGTHMGAVFFTLGERHGFTITKKSPEDTRYYVVAKDIQNNTITVAPSFEKTVHAKKDYLLEKILLRAPLRKGSYKAQIRYHGELLSCVIEGDHIVFEEPILIASGQSVVIYDGTLCVGGGVVK